MLQKGLPMTKKNEILLLDDRDLEEKVYIVRGVQVMLDFELFPLECFPEGTKRHSGSQNNAGSTSLTTCPDTTQRLQKILHVNASNPLYN